MEKLNGQTIGEIVAEDYRTAGVFKKFGLDFCCGGKRTVSEACEKKGVDLEKVSEELTSLGNANTANHNYNDWSPALLVDYIIERHHEFVRSKTSEIEMYARKVARVHGDRHEELIGIRDTFLKLKEEMLSHLMKEEEILFPYIKKLVEADKNDSAIDEPDFGTAANPVAMMEAEHEDAGNLMAQIEELSNGFTPPQDACATYRVLFQNLEGFQDDLHKHVHLENNVLFPKALRLENRLN
ncbi:iron-sulfur cluster repair di-iron protein [Fodinibius halophilus]|uniref:Iron-sulfur cluster repair di-iron protein n=1 Tax=Fodinibius halophilus TaxID=1736908 RepID=A0A6M1TF06_9BACT|nr:iron-sulfur cluster repair di-iron protein [Fodinibius halophilus]NGP88762.1 iron-sulfur cluster repair di-iron protein [Fodinibius halophilus]